MNIPKEQIAEKKRIGKLGNDAVWMVSLVGGLNLCVIASPKPEIAGISPHPAVSRHIAQKKFPEMKLNIQKSEEIPLGSFDDMIAKYEAITDAIIKLQNG